MKKISTLFICFALAACGGRAPDPVITFQKSDAQLTCQQIEQEKKLLFTRNNQLDEEIKQRDTKNLVIGSVGWILIFLPYVFLDTSDSIEQDQISIYYRLQEMEKIRSRLAC